MRSDLPSPQALAEAPEIAALYNLDVALTLVDCALLAAWPELHQPDFFEGPRPPTIEAFLAESLLLQADVLQSTVARLRDVLALRSAGSLTCTGDF